MRSLKTFLITSVAALSLTAASLPAFAAMGSHVVGMSADGSVILFAEYDQVSHSEFFTLTNTATDASFEITAPADATGWFQVSALSADGTSVAGYYETANGDVAYIWSKANGFLVLPIPGGQAYVNAISADGSAVAGSMATGPFYWSAGTGLITLGTLGGAYSSNVRAMSGDGNTVVGTAYDQTNNSRAFVWAKGDANLTNIDDLFVNSSANFVNADGSVVAGYGRYQTWASRGFRWTEAGGMVDIGDLGGGATQVTGMSRDGNVLVGSSNDGIGYKAFRYEAASDHMDNLGTFGGDWSEATAANADGSVIVGAANDANNDSKAFRWTAESGMLTIEQWLSDNGVTSISFDAERASHVSDDGNVVAGTTADYHTFYARVGSGAGVIELEEFLPTVANAGATSVNAYLRSADTVMFGAQGQPMRNLLTPGQKAVWGTVDLGYDDSQAANGGVAVGEFGFGYGLADGITARLGVGVVHNDFSIASGGSIATTGFYVAPEASIELLDNIYVTLGGYLGTGSVSTNRGYLNGGVLDFSTGATNAHTFGAKVRLDWVDAFVVEDTSFTPYVGLSYANTSVDAYTENGGSFPVSYNAMSEHSTIARIGADVVHHLTDDFRVVAKAELAYQFEDTSSQVAGTIIGLNTFTLPGQTQNQVWVRGGIGAEYDVGGGTASVMLNVTSRGQDPDVWVRSSFSVKF